MVHVRSRYGAAAAAAPKTYGSLLADDPSVITHTKLWCRSRNLACFFSCPAGGGKNQPKKGRKKER